MTKHRFYVSRIDENTVFVQVLGDENGLDSCRGSLTMPDEEWELLQHTIRNGNNFQDDEYTPVFVIGHIAHAFLQGG